MQMYLYSASITNVKEMLKYSTMYYKVLYVLYFCVEIKSKKMINLIIITILAFFKILLNSI